MAEQEEKLKNVREDRAMQAREVVRMYNMCADVRFELEVVKDERDEAKRKAIRLAGPRDERAKEMERMAEDAAGTMEEESKKM